MRGFRAQVDRLKRDVQGIVKPDMRPFIVTGPGGKCLVFIAPGCRRNRFSFSGRVATCFYGRWKAAADEAEREALIEEATRTQACCSRHSVARKLRSKDEHQSEGTAQ